MTEDDLRDMYEEARQLVKSSRPAINENELHRTARRVIEMCLDYSWTVAYAWANYEEYN